MFFLNDEDMQNSKHIIEDHKETYINTEYILMYSYFDDLSNLLKKA